MRILIVTHAPLTAEFGASQIALNLGEALRAHGHDATVWSPQPLPENIRWWRSLRAMRASLDNFLSAAQAFDVIDCPPCLITRRTSRSAVVIARSTQPDLLYFWHEMTGRGIRGVKSLYLPFEFLYTLYHITLVLGGWSRARRILCLGSIELNWMRRWLPWWRHKLNTYFITPSASDQLALRDVRSARVALTEDKIRFLWIGRWVVHKGRKQLLDFIARWNVARPQDTFTIAGCGSVAEKEFPVELLRSEVVSLVPSFKRSELSELLARHDIGLFTSSVEGWGLSLNEMLESGMVVYATQAGGVSDLRPYHESLRKFPPELASISANPTKHSLNAYFDVFDWSNIAQSYLRSIDHDMPNPLGLVPDPLAQQHEAST